MSAFRYPATPHARRHGPQGYADVDGYRPWLRDEFCFRCVYCLFREAWGRVKAGFSIDHFLPVSRHPERALSYDNLLYACAACNLAKGDAILPDPLIVLLNDNVRVNENGQIVGVTRDARLLIRLLGLDGREETEARLLWIGIIALAKRCDPDFYHRLMSFPNALPCLPRLRPPGGNSRPEGLTTCFYAQRCAGILPATY